MTKDIFPDVKEVTQGDRTALDLMGLLNSNKYVVSWGTLAPWLTNRKLTTEQAKLLVLIELERVFPRFDLLHRLVSYISYFEKEINISTIISLLTKK
tara:strand:+ start:23002 stop:23292 length:291 start_codon:yes stop_codon:yes gene_type:complete